MPRHSLPPEEASRIASKQWLKKTAAERREAMKKVRSHRDMSKKARKAIGKRLAEARAKKKKEREDG